VAAAFLAEAERSSGERAADAAPPRSPPVLAGSLFSAFPRPEPLFLPPPELLLTVAQAPFFVALFDVLGLTFLFVRISGFVTFWHDISSMWIDDFRWQFTVQSCHLSQG
jgi:hypothetical protein